MGKTYPKVVELLKNEFDVKGVTRYAFCKQTGINATSVERYLQGTTEPNQASIEKLAKYFNVTAEVLRQEENFTALTTQMSAERLLVARRCAGLSMDEVAERLDINRVNIARWEKGDVEIPKKHIGQIAKITGFPENWFRGAPLRGLLVSRPVLPDRQRPVHTLHQIEADLLEYLPSICEGATCVALRSLHGSAYVFTDVAEDGYCLVVFAVKQIDNKLQLLADRAVTVDDVAWQKAYVSSEGVSLKGLLETAGCEEWTGSVAATERSAGPCIVTAKLEITHTSANAVSQVNAAIAMLREFGFSVSASFSTDPNPLVANG